MKKAGCSSILVVVVLLAVAVIAEAQQPTKVPRIGLCVSELAIPTIPGLRSRHSGKGCEISVILRGKTSWLSIATAEGKLDRIPSLVAELVQLKVDVLVVRKSTSDPRSQAGDQDDPHCHGDNSGSSRDWDSR